MLLKEVQPRGGSAVRDYRLRRSLLLEDVLGDARVAFQYTEELIAKKRADICESLALEWLFGLEKDYPHVFEVRSGRLSLHAMPDVLVDGSWEPSNRFFHIGRVNYKSNSLDNWNYFGVFGCPDPNFPTYLTRDGYYTAPTPHKFHENPAVEIWIDKQKLLKRRSLFIDPESIAARPLDFPGSYFVVGGIPKEAIISIENYKPGAKPGMEIRGNCFPL